MGMTVIVEIADKKADEKTLDKIFAYFKSVDEKFSTYKNTSEITAINNGLLKEENFSPEMKEVLALSEKTKNETGGYFDIRKPDGKLDPSGLVKGWAIFKAAEILWRDGFENFYIDAGGDIQTSGKNSEGEMWSVGIRNPFNPEKEIVKVLSVSGQGVATSGTYARGEHIYNPHEKSAARGDLLSLTVVGPNVYEVDRFATAAFAMGEKSLDFISGVAGLEAFAIDKAGMASQTAGFEKYVKQK